MGNLIFRHLFRKKEVRILFMGLDAAGKTTTLYRLKLGEVVTTIPTIGFNVETVNVKNIAVTAWDVGGRDKIRPLYRHYYQNTDGLVYILDSNDRERFDMAIDELKRFVGESELNGIPVLILANKQDLSDALSPREIASSCMDIMPKRPWTVYGVSATDDKNSGLYEAFEWLVDAIAVKERQEMAERWTQTWQKESPLKTDIDKAEETKTSPDGNKFFFGNIVESLKQLFKAT